MMDADELALVRTSLRHLLTSTPPARLPLALLDQGWDDLVADDGDRVIAALFEEHGAARAASPALDVVMLGAIAAATSSEAAGLDAATTAVVLPALSRRRITSATVTNGNVVVQGLLTAGWERAATVLAASPAGVHSIDGSRLDMASTGALDSSLTLQTASGTVPLAAAPIVAGHDAWERAIDAGRRALASELVGIGRVMMSTTIEYITARKQYKRPIGSFQSVQHRMAEAHVAWCAAADAVVTAYEEHDSWSAMAAKALAGRGVLQVGASCFQVHGAIAFTEEHELHRYIQRANMLDALLGTYGDLAWEIGQQLLGGGSVPRIPRL